MTSLLRIRRRHLFECPCVALRTEDGIAQLFEGVKRKYVRDEPPNVGQGGEDDLIRPIVHKTTDMGDVVARGCSHQ